MSEVSWGSTMLHDLQKCPWYFNKVHLEGWTKARLNVDMVFGSAIHDALCAYYDALPAEPDTLLQVAVRQALVSGAELPDDGGDTVKTRQNLVRALIAWHDEYGLGSDGWLPLYAAADPANEVPFSIPTSTREDFLTGVFDRVVVLRGKPAILDTKTTRAAQGTYFFRKFKPDTQVSLYAAAAHRLFPDYRGKFVIDAFFVKEGEVAVWREELSIDEAPDEVFEDAEFWIKLAREMAERNIWPRNRTSCGLYGGCMFRGVCSSPKRIRGLVLQQEFMQEGVDNT